MKLIYKVYLKKDIKVAFVISEMLSTVEIDGNAVSGVRISPS
jgi:hypothetical protein